MPELTVRALGEMIHLPLYEQLRILGEQKYPRQVPAVFRVPFYEPALRAIRQYYRDGNDRAIIDSAIRELQASGYIPQKVEHNVAVLEAFRRGHQRQRKLEPIGTRTFLLDLAGLQVRFRPDLAGIEGGRTRYILYNFRAAEVPSETAKTILELACYVLDSNGVDCRPRDLEFVSLRSDRFEGITRIRSQTLRRARQNAGAIIQLWPTI